MIKLKWMENWVLKIKYSNNRFGGDQIEQVGKIESPNHEDLTEFNAK